MNIVVPIKVHVLKKYYLCVIKPLVLLKICYVDHEVEIEIKSKEIEKAERKEFKVSERERKSKT